MSTALRGLREELSREQQTRQIRDFLEAAINLMQAAEGHTDVLQHVFEATCDVIVDAAAMAHEMLGQTIAGVAADYSLRLVRAVTRHVAEQWDALSEDEEVQQLFDGKPVEELIDMDSPSGDFIRGQYLALVLADALEDGCDTAVVARIAVAAAQAFLRGWADPRLQQFPGPFVGESREQADERLLQYLRLASSASSEAEREVILNLRRSHLLQGSQLGSLVGLATGYYQDTLRRLA